uniref:PsbP C-terminal domain-containing protein n=2 Tax=Emiliania huxleyi TaxID=2903 RepID=A0A0D3JC51_EMIH1
SDQRFYPYSAGGLDYGPGFQRYVDPASRFEFRYPANYVQDQAVFLRNADRAYAQRTMDPALAAARGGAAARAPPRGSGPDVAFGPPGQAGEENLSVVIGSLVAGFSLRGTLGPPAEAAERLLQSSIAKPGVRETTLLGSFERASAQTGLPLYQFEYKVEYPSLNKAPTYTVCVVGAKRDNLFTFASRVPAAEWEARPEVAALLAGAELGKPAAGWGANPFPDFTGCAATVKGVVQESRAGQFRHDLHMVVCKEECLPETMMWKKAGWSLAPLDQWKVDVRATLLCPSALLMPAERYGSDEVYAEAVASVQKQMTQAFQIYQLRANVQHSGQKVYFDENEVSVRLGFSPGVAQPNKLLFEIKSQRP